MKKKIVVRPYIYSKIKRIGIITARIKDNDGDLINFDNNPVENG